MLWQSCLRLSRFFPVAPAQNLSVRPSSSTTGRSLRGGTAQFIAAGLPAPRQRATLPRLLACSFHRSPRLHPLTFSVHARYTSALIASLTFVAHYPITSASNAFLTFAANAPFTPASIASLNVAAHVPFTSASIASLTVPAHACYTSALKYLPRSVSYTHLTLPTNREV